MINENQHEPAMPVDPVLADTVGLCPSQSLGLSKREHFAGLIIAQIAVTASDRLRPQHYEHTAKQAVYLADELLKELDK